MIERIMGVLKLDVNTFEEIERAEDATAQAGMLIAVIAVINAIGAYFFAGSATSMLEGLEGIEGFDVGAIASSISPVGSAIQAFIGMFITWILWSVATYFVGTAVFKGNATIPKMLRVIGFGMAPQLLSFIPCIGFFAGIYSLVTVFVGIRQGLDFDEGKEGESGNFQTAATVGISFVAVIIVRLCVLGPIFTAVFAIAG